MSIYTWRLYNGSFSLNCMYTTSEIFHAFWSFSFNWHNQFVYLADLKFNSLMITIHQCTLFINCVLVFVLVLPTVNYSNDDHLYISTQEQRFSVYRPIQNSYQEWASMERPILQRRRPRATQVLPGASPQCCNLLCKCCRDDVQWVVCIYVCYQGRACHQAVAYFSCPGNVDVVVAFGIMTINKQK